MMLLVVDHCAYEGVIALALAGLTAWNSYQQSQIHGVKKDSRQRRASEDKEPVEEKTVFPRR